MYETNKRKTAQIVIDGRHPYRLDKVDIFHNIIACASCGNPMHYTSTMLPEESYYSCRYCLHKGKNKCSLHQIAAGTLKQIVFQQIRWVTELARKSPEGFYEKVYVKKGDEKNSTEAFITNANRFIDIQELTPEIVKAFIYKIYIYEKMEECSHIEGNNIDIVFTVGFREQHTVRTSDAIIL